MTDKSVDKSRILVFIIDLLNRRNKNDRNISITYQDQALQQIHRAYQSQHQVHVVEVLITMDYYVSNESENV